MRKSTLLRIEPRGSEGRQIGTFYILEDGTRIFTYNVGEPIIKAGDQVEITTVNADYVELVFSRDGEYVTDCLIEKRAIFSP